MFKNEVEFFRRNKGVKGITKSHLAHRIGVSRSYITKLEQGKLKPSIDLAFKIAQYFDCKIEDVFTIED